MAVTGWTLPARRQGPYAAAIVAASTRAAPLAL